MTFMTAAAGSSQQFLALPRTIGIPAPQKIGERRLAVSPEGVARLVNLGHRVVVQTTAGHPMGWTDAAYRSAGAGIVRDLETVYDTAGIICGVKEPQLVELAFIRRGQVLFTYLHLGGNLPLLAELQKKGAIGIGYETVTSPKDPFPLLRDMSRIAGSIAYILGAHYMLTQRGRLIASASALHGLKIAVIGCGQVGQTFLRDAVQSRASITALDTNEGLLDQLRFHYRSRVRFLPSTPETLAEIVPDANLLIGAVMVAGARTPVVVPKELVAQMLAGGVIFDVAVDQGGCVAGTRPTSIEEPTYLEGGVVRYAVPNMPSLAYFDASLLLAQAVLPRLERLATRGYEQAFADDPALGLGFNLDGARIMHEGLLRSIEEISRQVGDPQQALAKQILAAHHAATA